MLSVKRVLGYRFITAMLWGAAGCHLALLYVANLPANRQIEPLLHLSRVYTRTFFPQGWSFFAPNVSSRETEIFVRARDSAGRQTVWFNLTAFYASHLHDNRFALDDRVYEALFHASSRVDREIQSTGDLRDDDSQNTAIHLIDRVASMFIATHVTSIGPAMIQIGVRSSSAKLRNQSPDTKNAYATLPWQAFQRVAQ